MSETVETTSNSSPRRRKVQALLAGGAVLGVGALVTLAAWTDDEFALGQFGASTFNLEGSTVAAGEGYEDHDDIEGPATLTFDGDPMMTPNETVYAPFWVRLDAATNVDGAIEAEGGISVAASEGANADNMSFEVYHGVDACDSDSIETGTLVASGGTLNDVDANPEAIDDLTANDAGTAGEEELLCFAVTSADEDSFLEGGTAATTWQVQATSDEG